MIFIFKITNFLFIHIILFIVGIIGSNKFICVHWLLRIAILLVAHVGRGVRMFFNFLLVKWVGGLLLDFTVDFVDLAAKCLTVLLNESFLKLMGSGDSKFFHC